MHVVAGTGTTENRPTAQAVHTTLAVIVQPAALLDVPAAHVVHGVHVAAPAAVEKLLPATQDAQTRFAVGVHAEATKLPAAHVDAAAQAEHGAKPVADHVLPLTHAGTATQASAVAFHA